MEDLDELVPGGVIGSRRAHGMRAAGRCADASLEQLLARLKRVACRSG